MKKTVIISGGASGIGRASAELFSTKGLQVYVLDKISYEGQVKEINSVVCDLSSAHAIKKAINSIASSEKQIDILVSSAGIHYSGSIEETDEQAFDELMSVNLKGTFFLLKSILPIMRVQQSGQITLLGSDQSTIAKKNSALYGASKAAIAQLAKSTALDYAQYNIQVNCICPGTIDTPLYRAAIEKYAKKTDTPLSLIKAAEAKAQPLGRIGSSEEVAKLICFLALESSFMTGGLIPIDGGYTAQ